MIKVFIPQDKTQGKTDVRGLWINDKGKLFYDYLTIDKIKLPDHYLQAELNTQLEVLKVKYNQEALFYTFDSKGYIYYNHNRQDILRNKDEKRVLDIRDLKRQIKEFLRCYKGVTIYKELYQGRYIFRLEAYY